MYQSESIELPVLLTYRALPDDQGCSCKCSNELAIARDPEAEDCGSFLSLCFLLVAFVAIRGCCKFPSTLGSSVDSRSAQRPVHCSLGVGKGTKTRARVIIEIESHSSWSWISIGTAYTFELTVLAQK